MRSEQRKQPRVCSARSGLQHRRQGSVKRNGSKSVRSFSGQFRPAVAVRLKQVSFQRTVSANGQDRPVGSQRRDHCDRVARLSAQFAVSLLAANRCLTSEAEKGARPVALQLGPNCDKSKTKIQWEAKKKGKVLFANLSLNIIRTRPEEFGSSGRIRTGDLSINSRMLYR